MLYRTFKNLSFKFIFTVAVFLIAAGYFSSCAISASIVLKPEERARVQRLSVFDLIPSKYSFYIGAFSGFKMIKPIKETSEKFLEKNNIPPFLLDNTDNIVAVFPTTSWGYVAFEGKYPNVFMRKEFFDKENWIVNVYRGIRYFYSETSEILIIYPKDNLLVATICNKSVIEEKAQFIIDIMMDEKMEADIIYAENTVLHFSADNSVVEMLGKIPSVQEMNLSLDAITGVKLDITLKPWPRKIGGMEGVIMFETKANANAFASTVRLLISNALRAEKVPLKEIKKNYRINADDNNAIISIVNLSSEKLNSFIEKIISPINNSISE